MNTCNEYNYNLQAHIWGSQAEQDVSFLSSITYNVK